MPVALTPILHLPPIVPMDPAPPKPLRCRAFEIVETMSKPNWYRKWLHRKWLDRIYIHIYIYIYRPSRRVRAVGPVPSCPSRRRRHPLSVRPSRRRCPSSVRPVVFVSSSPSVGRPPHAFFFYIACSSMKMYQLLIEFEREMGIMFTVVFLLSGSNTYLVKP